MAELIPPAEHPSPTVANAISLATAEGYMAPKSPENESRRDSLFDLDLGPPPPKPTPTTFLDLPIDILLFLSDLLPAPSAISLRLTCRAIHTHFPKPTKPPPTALCLLTASARHQQSHEDQLDGKVRCALCKNLYPTSLFHKAAILSSSLPFENFRPLPPSPPSPAHSSQQVDHDLAIATSQSLSHLSDVVQDTPHRICAWHINRFILPPSAALIPSPALDALTSHLAHPLSPASDLPFLAARVCAEGWASTVETACMHCGLILVCVCSVGGCGTCGCGCEGCGTREVRCWWRLAKGRYGAGSGASFEAARRKWLIARAEEVESFGWEGGRGEGVVDWGMVRVGKCGNGKRDLGKEGKRKHVG
ncbi:LisH domain-containing protein [Sphaceloma murrayae]|uniref:LisH domain-containing protein n=1 Tax=Sphaceloma murrayae TaxID=2082308 RepID=A0A2K1QX96_9PEZI|nr:LisH domain-containing protein [Sphaceloma murrayae]